MSETTPTVPTPDLRIVPIPSLVPHELEDPLRAQPLIHRLSQDGTLNNPPVVTPLAEAKRFVILDGTNRIIALEALGYEHALVQVVRYEPPHVELHTWNHVVTAPGASELQARLAMLPGIEIQETDPFHARAALARRAILAYAQFADGRTVSLGGGGLDLLQRTRLLQAIVDTYLEAGHLHRTDIHDLESLTRLYPDLSAAIIFPKYEHIEILDLAEAGLPVPTGISRHVIHGRALHLNYPLAKLSEDKPLEDKNRELAEWIRTQFSRRRVRYYAESTYLFDE